MDEMTPAILENLNQGFSVLSLLKSGESIEASPADAFFTPPAEWMLLNAGNVLQALAVLGFWEIEMMEKTKKTANGRTVQVRKLSMKPIGEALTKVWLENPFEQFNEWYNPSNGYLEERQKAFSEALQGCFAGEIDSRRIESYFEEYYEDDERDDDGYDDVWEDKEETGAEMTGSYIFKVSLSRSVWRRIQIASDATLQALHEAIQNGFEMDDDHLYAFFMDNKAWSRNGDAYWSPGNDEGPFTHKVRLCHLNLIPKQKFLYLFDFGEEWRFTVTFERSSEEKVSSAKVIAAKGGSLEQYSEPI